MAVPRKKQANIHANNYHVILANNNDQLKKGMKPLQSIYS